MCFAAVPSWRRVYRRIGIAPRTWNERPYITPGIPILTPLPLIKQPNAFTDPDWLFEIKYDGFRCLAYIGEGVCRLVSRNGNTFSRFKDLSRSLSGFERNVILDGEIACVDSDGHPQFDDLMSGSAPAHLFAFDILLLDSDDLRDTPCIERKAILKSVVEDGIARLQYVDHIEEQGEQLFDIVCERDMEGIVAKPKASLYQLTHGRTPWIKIKNPGYSQAVDRGEWFNAPQ